LYRRLLAIYHPLCLAYSTFNHPGSWLSFTMSKASAKDLEAFTFFFYPPHDVARGSRGLAPSHTPIIRSIQERQRHDAFPGRFVSLPRVLFSLDGVALGE
jgi:hypothetical protein